MCPVIKNGDSNTNAAIGKLTALNIANFTEQAHKIVARARDEGDQIIAEARQQAQQIIDQANEQMEQARIEADKKHAEADEKGYAEGFNRGQADGQADGAEKAFNQATDTFEKQCGRLKQLLALAVEQLAEARGECLRQAKDEMLQFALEIASRITNFQSRGDIRAAEEILKKVIAAAPCAQKLKIRVSREQYDQLSVYANEYIKQINSGTEVEIIGDELLSCGDIMLESPEGGVDGRVEVQFDNIARALVGHDWQPMDFAADKQCKNTENAEQIHQNTETLQAGSGVEEVENTGADTEEETESGEEENTSLEDIIGRTGELLDEISDELKVEESENSQDADTDEESKGVDADNLEEAEVKKSEGEK